MGNTAFCLFEPHAKGLTADSFPTEESVYFGSRVGGLYPYCISRANDPPKTSEGYESHRRERIAFIKKRRLQDLGETDVDPALIERIMWEGDHGADAPGMARIMDDLAAKHPLKPTAAESLPVLPLLPLLSEAINMGATDNRAVVAIVLPSGQKDTMSAHMARLLFEQGIAGRVHAVRMSADEWKAAKSSELVEGGELAAGIFFMHPDSFGLHATVHAEIPATASEAQIRGELTASLKRFHETWSKLDRATHMQVGVAKRITWKEWNFKTKEVARMTGPLDRVKKREGAEAEGQGDSQDPAPGTDPLE